MKRALLFFFVAFNFLYVKTFGQIVDIDYRAAYKRAALVNPQKDYKEADVQVLKNGFVDFLTDGNILASARLLRINIGERDKFYLPLFIYTGASGNAFGSDKLNETTVSNLLNPIGGTVNLSFSGLQLIIPSTTVTRLEFAYQAGGRLINGKDSITGENLHFFNGMINAGLSFQTGAWTPDDPENMGIFYAQAKFVAAISSQGEYERMFGKGLIDNGYLLGYAIDAGIEINRVISAKLGVYQYTNHGNIELLKSPVVKFSLDYTLRK
ncbi:hypothetical protein F0L74_21385 [Chitinophaga agrisoli]|uniref:Uncharacterized protein n=1 Tax=Chitinophaga agrisoli TaxID=2607653 RepID=A0A5B2VI62_9BACT|nr:hypothetical protein [Chitinophaga agrisoli]KAA2238771.1 hypothetical protein F0L74_21385 [Chitinophaga agrisoli]